MFFPEIWNLFWQLHIVVAKEKLSTGDLIGIALYYYKYDNYIVKKLPILTFIIMSDCLMVDLPKSKRKRLFKSKFMYEKNTS